MMHYSAEAAAKAAGPGFAVYLGGKKKGDRWVRADEQLHTRVI